MWIWVNEISHVRSCILTGDICVISFTVQYNELLFSVLLLSAPWTDAWRSWIFFTSQGFPSKISSCVCYLISLFSKIVINFRTELYLESAYILIANVKHLLILLIFELCLDVGDMSCPPRTNAQNLWLWIRGPGLESRPGQSALSPPNNSPFLSEWLMNGYLEKPRKGKTWLPGCYTGSVSQGNVLSPTTGSQGQPAGDEHRRNTQL